LGAHRFGIATSAGFSDLDGPNVYENQSLHVVCVYDPDAGFQGVDTNGVLESANYNARVPLATVSPDFGFLGRSLFFADGYLNAAIDEFRIYEGRLTSEQLAADYRTGPDQVVGPSLAATLSGGQVVLTWPVAAAGFTLESTPRLEAGATWTPTGGTPSQEGDHYRVSVAVAGTAFFRLRK
jgi:hypothetical protein